jgi:hypothetical protein
VSLVHRMETNVARQSFQIISFAACIHFLAGRFLSPRVRRCKETKFLTVRSRVVRTPALRSLPAGPSYALRWPRVGSTVLVL